jgi:nucleotide-binding universal stress UspA family protein
LDGSSGSTRALEWAIQLAKALEAEVVAVYVLELLSPTAVGYGLAPTLIAIASDLQADLIVTGSRGLGGFGELLLGSVSHQLVLHAPMPVVVIPPEHRKVTVTVPAASEPASVAAP